MRINRQNYEIFFIDFADGNLSAEQMQEVREFLSANPDLAQEFDEVREALSSPEISSSEVFFPDKSILKKEELPVTREELEFLLVKELEGQLNTSEEMVLSNITLQYPSLEKARKDFARTRLIPEDIHFPLKPALRFDETIDLGVDDMMIIACLEGDLNLAQHAAFESRLASDVAFHALYSRYRSIRLSDEVGPTIGKSLLKIPDAVDMSEINNLLIAKVEGDLTLEQNNHLSALLAGNEMLQKELALFYQTRLNPAAVVFDEKVGLKRKEAVVFNLRRLALGISSAAAIAVIILLVNYHPSSTARMASNTEITMPIRLNNSTGKESPDLAAPVASEKNDTPGVQLHNPAKSGSIIESYASHDVEPQSRTPQAPEKIHSIPSSPFDAEHGPSLVLNNPDMQLVYEAQPVPAVIQTTESVTLLSYLTKAATEKLENTYAYSFAEKQVEKITTRAKEDVHLEKAGNNEEKIHFKLRGIEFERNVSRKSKDKPNMLERLQRYYQKVVN